MLSKTLLPLSLAFFAISAVFYRYESIRSASVLNAVGWVLMGLFWISMVPQYLFEESSVLKSIGAFVALPISVYFASIIYTNQIEELFKIGTGAAIMGAIYLPLSYLSIPRRFLIENVAVQTAWLVTAVFNQPLGLREGPVYGYQSGITYLANPGGAPLYTHIELACTGLGSIAVVIGVLSILEEPMRKRLGAMAIAVVTIYIFNLLRTVFITASFGGQWFQIAPELITSFSSYTDPRIASFIIADKLIAQSLSAIVLFGLFVIISRYFPSFLQILESLRNVPKKG